MAKAIWNDIVLAESNRVQEVEGNIFFPAISVNRQYLKETEFHTQCYWKGTASYYDIVVEGNVNKNAAFYYPEPSEKAAHIKGYIAFWERKNITVEK